ncbi:TonB-dependent receptor [Pendulispora rubella]|uniref:TonB-dependent receptor n=1 Tax=Pendulispora rubella TaxID=2741070 RepID=A0ABZ2KR79_9BACT
MNRLYFLFLLLAAWLGATESAWAQNAPPPLVPPRLLTQETIGYPEGAQGEAVVVVELTIDTGGAVAQAIIVSGEKPFTTAVLARAPTWRFVSARRGDVDVRARVRMRIEFHPPPPPVPSAPHASAPPTRRTAVVIEREEEVSVRGRQEPGKITFTGGEVRQMPGAFGDAFRMMEALPGVTPIVSGLPFFYVRGAPPGNTGYYLDGIRIPLLYHFALGPGVVHPGLIDRVDFFSGAPPAQYGRFSGGILAGYTRPPATELHGEWNVRLVDSGGMVEAPFAGGRGSVLVGGRYGYPGLLASLISPEVTVSYWDYQARASYALTNRDTLTVFAFGSSDYLGSIKEDYQTKKKTEEQLFKTGFHRLDLRYDHRLGESGKLRLALTLGADESGADIQGDSKVGNGRLRSVGLRTEIEDRLGPNLRVRAGADVVWDYSDLLDPDGNRLSPEESPYSILYAPRNDVTLGAYADAAWRISRRVELTAGLRADVFTSRRIDQPVIHILDRQHPIGAPATATVAVDPRISARVLLMPKLTYLATFGITHQPPSTLIPIAGLGFTERRDHLQTAFQASQGLELALPLDFTATANVFLHEYRNLSDATASCGEIPIGDWDNPCLTRRVRGRAYGFEFLLRRALTKKLTGWLSYTLSRSTREGLLVGTSTHAQIEVPQTVPAEFDRTHVFQVIGAYDLGHHWRAGLRFMLYSGRPRPRFDDDGNPSTLPTDTRFPPYYRVDLRLEKAWKIGRTGRIAFVFEGLNVTLNKEVINIECKSKSFGGPRSCEEQKIGPVAIPGIGVEGSF